MKEQDQTATIVKADEASAPYEFGNPPDAYTIPPDAEITCD